MDDKLFIYEYPIDNDIKLYIEKKRQSFNKESTNEMYLTFINDIKINSNYNRNSENNMCTNFATLDIINDIEMKSNMGETVKNIIKEYSTKSCDPIKFNYSVYPLAKNSLDTYKYNMDEFNKFYSNNITKLGLIDTDLCRYIFEGLLLPEFNFITSYKDRNGNKCNIGGPTITNKNFKIPSLNPNILMSTFIKVKELVQKKIINKDRKLTEIYKTMESKIKASTLTNMPKIIYIHKIKIDNTFSKCCLFGDIHASLQSMLRSILRLVVMKYINSNFELVKDFHIFFLGDLVDRNVYGIDTIFIILCLFIKNPNQVHIIRGNHEEMTLNYRFCFSNEFIKLVPDGSKDSEMDFYAEYVKTFSYFPTAIILQDTNKELIQLCHGGFYRDSNFIKNIKYDDEIILVHNPKHFLDISWADFKCGNISDKEIETIKKSHLYGNEIHRRGPIYRFNETIEYLKDTKMRFIIRGHQDLVDNTKVILSDKNKCKIPNKVYNDMIPIEYVDDIKTIQPGIGLIRRDHSFEVTVPTVDNIDGFVENYSFPPVITLTTGTTSRFVDCDGFAILELNFLQNGGNLARQNYKNLYELHKKIYTAIKKKKIE